MNHVRNTTWFCSKHAKSANGNTFPETQEIQMSLSGYAWEAVQEKCRSAGRTASTGDLYKAVIED
jgi:hypothetical protein